LVSLGVKEDGLMGGETRDRAYFVTFAPLVYSICRRFLRHTEDVEDAVQDTFLRLLRRPETIGVPSTAWVTAVARSCCVDLIRRSARERRRREQVASSQSSELAHQVQQGLLMRDAIRHRLHDGLQLISEQSRTLLIERFFRSVPLSVLAISSGRSVSAISRRVTSAVQELAEALRGIGVRGLSEGALSEYFVDAGLPALLSPPGDNLRFAPDWRAALLSPNLQKPQPASLIPGWSRPIRVGALISSASMKARAQGGYFVGCGHDPDVPLESTAMMHQPGLELVSIVEPDTSHLGQVERLARDHAIIGGLVDSTDVMGLSTLDVILLGFNWAMSPGTTAAIATAVRGGTGLLNEFWTGDPWVQLNDPHLRELSLADTPIVGFHVGVCGHSVLPATVHGDSPLLPGLNVGDSFHVVGCGPLFRPCPDARVLISKDMLVSEPEHGLIGVTAMRMPVYITGQLARGRIAVVNLVAQRSLFGQLSVRPSQYFANLITWLAEPRKTAP
jgi:RNA polymerase sigma factor (sigma-70 family)